MVRVRCQYYSRWSGRASSTTVDGLDELPVLQSMVWTGCHTEVDGLEELQVLQLMVWTSCQYYSRWSGGAVSTTVDGLDELPVLKSMVWKSCQYYSP
ncbi:hypothetical protein J6590_056861 [Homalodisca vitripennis]|nr:hypothetical protein J6590_056861 [Homalodisca vitripennis]